MPWGEQRACQHEIAEIGALWPAVPGQPALRLCHAECASVVARYSYTNKSGPGNSHDNPSRRRSRQFSQLCPSRAST